MLGLLLLLLRCCRCCSYYCCCCCCRSTYTQVKASFNARRNCFLQYFAAKEHAKLNFIFKEWGRARDEEMLARESGSAHNAHNYGFYTGVALPFPYRAPSQPSCSLAKLSSLLFVTYMTSQCCCVASALPPYCIVPQLVFSVQLGSGRRKRKWHKLLSPASSHVSPFNEQ